jgi:hypothetical protein
LRGEKKGKSEIFANLTGFAGKIRLTSKSTLLVPLERVRTSKFSTFLDIFGKTPSIRNGLGAVSWCISFLCYFFLLFCFVSQNKNKETIAIFSSLLFSFRLVSFLILKIINFDELAKYEPKYGQVVEYSLSGVPIRSWHDPSGRVSKSVSGAIVKEDKLYYVSKSSTFVGIVDY